MKMSQIVSEMKDTLDMEDIEEVKAVIKNLVKIIETQKFFDFFKEET